MDKFLTSSQPDKINDEIKKLQLKAFRSNLKEDREELMYFLLWSWSAGDLVSRDLMEEIYG